jgi:adenylate kinase
MLEERGEKVETVISIIISDALVFERIQHRANIEGRKDDADPKTIQNRIDTYHAKTEPLIEYYKPQGKYNEICGIGTVEEIFEKISKML